MRTISQYDARRYKDELEGSSREAFSQWWDAEGTMRHYYDLKGQAERIEQILMYSVVEEEEFPKMRGPQRGAGRDGYGQ